MRILLINPPSPEQLGTPLLGLQYVAAALLADGHEVRVIDAAARFFPHDAAWIVRQAALWKPSMVGIGLFTRWVWHAYRLVDALRDCGEPWLLVAGGAHTTARPRETLMRGFHVAVTGEAEQSLPALARRLQAATGRGPACEALRRDWCEIPGLRLRLPTRNHGEPSIHFGPPAHAVEDLDSIPPAWTAQHLFQAEHYQTGWAEQTGAAEGQTSDAPVTPGGILTSRGCPARCTFCANYVTGRRFRHRSAEAVADEIRTLHERWDVSHLPCWDDALTAQPAHLDALCQALRDDLGFPFSFSAITRANMVTPLLLRQMRDAGLVHVNFGVESGDDEILRAIRKGIRTEHVVQALEWAKGLGLATACNFMLGFPEDSPQSMERSIRFMQHIAPMVDSFSTLGVAVPFPATPLYEEHHFSRGFTDWWLREDYSNYDAPPSLDDLPAFRRYYMDDANLELDFFHYSPAMKDLIREALRVKAEHNLRAMGLWSDDPMYAHGLPAQTQQGPHGDGNLAVAGSVQ